MVRMSSDDENEGETGRARPKSNSHYASLALSECLLSQAGENEYEFNEKSFRDSQPSNSRGSKKKRKFRSSLLKSFNNHVSTNDDDIN